MNRKHNDGGRGAPSNFTDAAMERMRATKRKQAEAREDLFVEAYLEVGGNGTEAAVKVWPKITRESAASNASAMLARPRVKTAIATRQAERLALARVSANEVLVNLANAHRFSVKDLFGKDGKPVKVKDMNERALAAMHVEHVEIEDVGASPPPDSKKKRGKGAETGPPPSPSDPTLKVVRMRQRDPNVIAEQLNKHLGNYELDNRQRAAIGVTIGRLTVTGLDFRKVHPRAPEPRLIGSGKA